MSLTCKITNFLIKTKTFSLFFAFLLTFCSKICYVMSFIRSIIFWLVE